MKKKSLMVGHQRIKKPVEVRGILELLIKVSKVDGSRTLFAGGPSRCTGLEVKGAGTRSPSPVEAKKIMPKLKKFCLE
jgi:hypothetical protein